MHKSTKLSFLLAASFVMSTAVAAPRSGQHLYEAQGSRDFFNSSRIERTQAIDRMLFGMPEVKTLTANPDPVMTIGPAGSIGDLDVAGGGVWFYTLDYETEDIYHNPYWTENVLRGFVVKIYDDQNKLRGTIRDEIELQDGETRCSMCDVTPFVTSHYYNTDDKYEIAIAMALNTPQYVNNYRTYVYQLDGETDSDGYSVPVSVIPNIVADVLDASENGNENVYVVEIPEGTDPIENPSSDEGELYWQSMMSGYYEIVIKSKAVDNSGPREIFRKKICIQMMPGDQGDSTPRLLTLMHNGTPMFVVSYYEQPFTEPILDVESDAIQRASNNLIVDFYRIGVDGVPELFNTARVDAPKTEADGVLATYYGVGDLLYSGDISFDQWGATEDKPSFIVTRQKLSTEDDDSTAKTYNIHDGDGNLVRPLFENSEVGIQLNDVPGQEPQMLFITEGSSSYEFHFVDIYSGEERCSFPLELPVSDGDPEYLTSNLDRVPWGDSYMYVDELRYPVEDGDITYMRLAWINDEGTWVRTDEVNMGADVMYAQCFINGYTLSDPNTFYIDDEELQEYMLLVKRGLTDGTTREELLIGQACSDSYPEGLTVFEINEDPRGALQNILPLSAQCIPTLMISFYDQASDNYTGDFYSLPFNAGAGSVDDILSDRNEVGSAISFDGSTVAAEGTVSIYATSGALVARGEGSVSTASMQPGMYIATAGGEARKIIVK